jgi:hypothetical protein
MRKEDQETLLEIVMVILIATIVSYVITLTI